MTKRPSENLPEPSHPFAKWTAGAAVSFWALGVQYFTSPWNQWGAILSPGVGYIFGHTLDKIIYRISEGSLKRKTERELLENQKSIDRLSKELQDQIAAGGDAQMIESYKVIIDEFYQKRIKIHKKS
jgi:hypothetical protein